MSKRNRGMNAAEICRLVYEALDLLQAARPGSAPAPERTARRQQAGLLLERLPPHWWRQLPDDESDRLLAAWGEVV